jgi:hypothetical protein
VEQPAPALAQRIEMALEGRADLESGALWLKIFRLAPKANQYLT